MSDTSPKITKAAARTEAETATEEDAIAKMLDPVDMSNVVTRSPMQEAWYMYRRNIPAMFGLIILTVILLITLYGSFI